MRVKRLLVISILILAACKSPTPAEQMDSIQSWLATAEMVGEAWLAHHVIERIPGAGDRKADNGY